MRDKRPLWHVAGQMVPWCLIARIRQCEEPAAAARDYVRELLREQPTEVEQHPLPESMLLVVMPWDPATGKADESQRVLFRVSIRRALHFSMERVVLDADKQELAVTTSADAPTIWSTVDGRGMEGKARGGSNG